MKRAALIVFLLGVIVTSCRKEKMYYCDCDIDYYREYDTPAYKIVYENYFSTWVVYAKKNKEAKEKCDSKERGLINSFTEHDNLSSPNYKKTTITGGGCEITGVKK